MEDISAILLAAGQSSRMGVLKPLLPWNGQPLIEYQIESLRQAGSSEIVVVVGHRGYEVVKQLKPRSFVTTVHNPNHLMGKTTSIISGLVNVSSSAKGIMILAVDQPRPVHIVERIVRAHLDKSPMITMPFYRGHGGHPMIFDSSLLEELKSITEQGQGLREITNRYIELTNKVEFSNPVVTLDLNTPHDLSKAQSLFESEKWFE